LGVFRQGESGNTERKLSTFPKKSPVTYFFRAICDFSFFCCVSTFFVALVERRIAARSGELKNQKCDYRLQNYHGVEPISDPSDPWKRSGIKEYEHLPKESANGRFPLIGCPNRSTETPEDMRLRLLHLLRLQGAASYPLPLGQRHCGCMTRGGRKIKK
jgi:hypothetical protein